MWAKTLAGTERSDMPLYLVQSDFGPFPFQSGRIMAMFQSVGMTQYFQISVKRGSSQLMIGAPPDFRSSAVMPQIPGARFVFSFRIAADISSAVGGVESIEEEEEEEEELYLTPNRQMYNASHIIYKIKAIYTHAHMWTHVH